MVVNLLFFNKLMAAVIHLTGTFVLFFTLVFITYTFKMVIISMISTLICESIKD